jgi:hypothetical protein
MPEINAVNVPVVLVKQEVAELTTATMPVVNEAGGISA